MAEDGRPDPLNEDAKPPRRWLPQTFVLVAVITGGVVLGAKIWQPVKRVEQKVTAPIREAVRRGSPLENLPDMVDEACPAVVSLHYDNAPNPAPQAILLTQDGFALTTAAIDPQAVITAWLDDGQKLKGHATGRDAIVGLTLIKFEGKDLTILPLGEQDLPRLGSFGFTLASPIGRGCAVETGLVSSDALNEGATSDYYIRVHAGVAPPAPGTPFLSGDGRLAGLALPGDGKGGASDHYLPIDILTTALGGLMRGVGAANSFGMVVEDLSPDLADRLGAARGRGAVIVMIDRNSAAARAGLQVGDVIVSAGQSPISSSSEFGRLLLPDRPIDLVVSRGLDQSTRTITLPAATAR